MSIKSCEEEQFNLEEEFQLLCEESASPNPTKADLAIDDDQEVSKTLPSASIIKINAEKVSCPVHKVSILPGGHNLTAELCNNSGHHINNNNIGTMHATLINEQDLEDAKRKLRKQAIFQKIQELQANAMVLAAKSEKLRISKTECEFLINKYMNKKIQRKNNNGFKSCLGVNSNSTVQLEPGNNNNQPVLNSQCLQNKQFVSVGVNTNITGKIRPVAIESSKATIGNRIFTEINEQSPYQFPNNQLVDSKKFLRTFSHGYQPDDTINNIFKTNTIIHHFSKTLQEEDDPDDDEACFFKDKCHVQGEMILKKMTFGIDDSTKSHECHDNLDISMTSDSDLTSAPVPKCLKKTGQNILSSAINFDDTTTQSETISVSLQLPAAPAPKLATSDRTGDKTYKGLQHFLTNDTNLQYEHNFQKKKLIQMVEFQCQVIQKDESGESNLKESNMKKMNLFIAETTKVDNDQHHKLVTPKIKTVLKSDDPEDEDDVDYQLSESSTTSPGDSVMNSTQNRTYNDCTFREASSMEQPNDEEDDDNDEELHEQQEKIPAQSLHNKSQKKGTEYFLHQTQNQPQHSSPKGNDFNNIEFFEVEKSLTETPGHLDNLDDLDKEGGAILNGSWTEEGSQEECNLQDVDQLEGTHIGKEIMMKNQIIQGEKGKSSSWSKDNYNLNTGNLKIVTSTTTTGMKGTGPEPESNTENNTLSSWIKRSQNSSLTGLGSGKRLRLKTDYADSDSDDITGYADNKDGENKNKQLSKSENPFNNNKLESPSPIGKQQQHEETVATDDDFDNFCDN